MRQVYYVPTGKIGLQFGRRFWEEDDRIFGGITRTSMNIVQIWYPSSGYLGEKGILVGYYNFNEDAVSAGRLSPAEREAVALESGQSIHPSMAMNSKRHTRCRGTGSSTILAGLHTTTRAVGEMPIRF